MRFVQEEGEYQWILSVITKLELLSLTVAWEAIYIFLNKEIAIPKTKYALEFMIHLKHKNEEDLTQFVCILKVKFCDFGILVFQISFFLKTF